MASMDERQNILAEVKGAVSKAGMNVEAVMWGSQIQIIIGGDDDDMSGAVGQVIRKALKSGHKVTHRGVSRWVTYTVLFDSSRIGSEAYTWDKSGNRVAHHRIMHTQNEGGIVSKEVVGTVYKLF